MTSRTPSRQSSVELDEKAGPLTRFLFNRQSSKRRKESDESPRSGATSPVDGSSPGTPTRTRSKKFTGFASRSLRKSQWRLFKHRTFFGSRASTKIKNNNNNNSSSSNNNNQLQLPRLTLRHPSVDGSAMPLAIDGDESEFLTIRTNQRRWTESESMSLKDKLQF